MHPHDYGTRGAEAHVTAGQHSRVALLRQAHHALSPRRYAIRRIDHRASFNSEHLFHFPDFVSVLYFLVDHRECQTRQLTYRNISECYVGVLRLQNLGGTITNSNQMDDQREPVRRRRAVIRQLADSILI